MSDPEKKKKSKKKDKAEKAEQAAAPEPEKEKKKKKDKEEKKEKKEKKVEEQPKEEPPKDKKKKDKKKDNGKEEELKRPAAEKGEEKPAAAAAPVTIAPDAIVGHCRCGTVEFGVSGKPMSSFFCHCLQCLESHGAGLVHSVVFNQDQVVVSKGQDSLVTPKMTGVAEGGGRYSCGKCGQRVFNHVPGMKIKAIFPACMNLPGSKDKPRVPSDWAPQFHCFYENRMYDVPDGLPKYVDLPASLGGSDKTVSDGAPAAAAGGAAPASTQESEEAQLKRLENNVENMESKLVSAKDSLSKDQRRQLLELKVDALRAQFELISGGGSKSTSTGKITFYYNPYSVTSRSAQLFLEHAGIEYEPKTVDIMKGEQFEDWYKAVNPNSLVPSIVDAGFENLTVFETPAILRHLATTRGTKFYPSDPKAQAHVDSAMDWINTTFYREFGYHMSYVQLFDFHKLGSEEADKALVAVAKTRTEKALKVLNDYWIGSNNYVAGASLTIADFWLAGLISVGDGLKNDYSNYPNVVRWRDNIKAEAKNYDKVFEAWNGYAGMLQQKEFVHI